jgi:hypothetical protein
MKFFLVFPLVVALALAESNPDADPEAAAEAIPNADLGAPHHGAPHHGAPHHGAPHGAPHGASHGGPYHQPPPPAYPHSPAPPPYGHEPAPYTPAPYGQHPGPHGHGPAGYAPDPYHQQSYGPPKCAIGNPKTFCLDDPEYPAYEISAAIEYNYDAVQQLYKDVLASTENSVDGLHDLEDEQYLCPTESGYVQPLRALNTFGKWRIVVNHVKAHYETLSQTARIEECLDSGEQCPLIPSGPKHYQTQCVQKFNYARMLVFDPYDKYLPFSIESFKLPGSCACHVGEYVFDLHH